VLETGEASATLNSVERVVKRAGGFTLIELMIVVGIIAIIAAIAIPNLVEARKSANELTTIAMLRTLHTSQTLFREADREGDGLIDYGSLAELEATDLIDAVLGSGTRSGYEFEMDRCYGGIPAGSLGETMFWSFANPIHLDASGNRSFCMNQDGVVFYTQQATITAGLAQFQLDGTVPPGTAPVR
jgi:type IV pilus assembly protein PilA